MIGVLSLYMQVFTSLLIGALSLGQAAPCLQDFSEALGAAGFIYDTIDKASVTCILQHVVEVEYVCIYCSSLTRPAIMHTRCVNVTWHEKIGLMHVHTKFDHIFEFLTLLMKLPNLIKFPPFM